MLEPRAVTSVSLGVGGTWGSLCFLSFLAGRVEAHKISNARDERDLVINVNNQ